MKKFDIWSEGKYIDMWSIPHVLSGVILAILFNSLGMGLGLNFILSTIIMTWWEFFEWRFMNVHEYITNKIMDVVTGIIGFMITYPLLIKYGFSIILPYFLFMIFAFLVLNFLGLQAHLKRIKKK